MRPRERSQVHVLIVGQLGDDERTVVSALLGCSPDGHQDRQGDRIGVLRGHALVRQHRDCRIGPLCKCGDELQLGLRDKGHVGADMLECGQHYFLRADEIRVAQEHHRRSVRHEPIDFDEQPLCNAVPADDHESGLRESAQRRWSACRNRGRRRAPPASARTIGDADELLSCANHRFRGRGELHRSVGSLDPKQASLLDRTDSGAERLSHRLGQIALLESDTF